MNNLTIAELKDLAKKNSIRIPTGYRKPEIVELLQQFLPNKPPPMAKEFNDLPNDVLMNILLNLDYVELRRICKTDKRVQKLCQNEYFWEQKYKRDFQNDKVLISDSWRDNYKYLDIQRHPKKLYQFEGVSMVTNNPDEFLKLILSIINNKYEKNDPLAKIQTDLLILLKRIMIDNYYGNVFMKSVNRNDLLLTYRQFFGQLLNQYDPTDRYRSSDKYTFLYNYVYEYYITPKYLILDLLTRKTTNAHGARLVNDININTVKMDPEDERYYRYVLDFFNFVKCSGELEKIDFYNFVKNQGYLIDPNVPIPTFEEIFSSPPQFDLNFLKSLIDPNTLSRPVFIDL